MPIIRLKRGTAANIEAATLQVGEPAFATDTDELYIGTATGKVKFAKFPHGNEAHSPDFVAVDGSTPLTSDWDIGDGRKILADQIRARDVDGLKLTDDAENGIFIEDGGNVGIGTTSPGAKLDCNGSAIIRGDIQSPSINNVIRNFMLEGAGRGVIKYIIPYFHSSLAYIDKRGGSITASPSPTTGSLSALVACKVGGANWQNPSGTISVEISLPSGWGWTVYFGFVIRSFYRAKDYSIEIYRTDTSAWETIVSETNNPRNTYVAKKYVGGNVVTKVRYNFSNFEASDWFQLSQLFGFADNQEYTPRAVFLPLDGGTMYGNINMNGNNRVVNLADPTAAQDAATKAYVDNKTGDPPYILFSLETRKTIIEKVKSQVSTPNLDSALLFFNSDEGQLEIFIPQEGEFRDLNGRVTQRVEPIRETFPAKVKYIFDEDFGIVRRMFVPVTRYRIKEGYTLDEDVGKITKGGKEVDPKEAIEQVEVTVSEPIVEETAWNGGKG